MTIKHLALRTHEDNMLVLDQNAFVLGPQFNRRVLLPNNPYKVRVHLGATQSGIGSSYVLLNFDTVDFDTSNSFNTTTHLFTAPISGYYALYGFANFSSDISGAFWANLGIFVNGANVATGTRNYNFSTSQQPLAYPNISDIQFLNVGDTVGIYGTCTSSQGTVNTGGVYSYFTVHLISA